MRVDLHAHYLAPQVLIALREDGASYGAWLEPNSSGEECLHFDFGEVLRPFPLPLLDLDLRREWMSRQGIDRQILSVWPDVFGYGLSSGAAARWHRLLNETMADVASQNPKHFGYLASVPLQHPQGATEELVHAVEQCGAVGVIVGSNIQGKNLDDLPLDDFWSLAERLDVPILLHPVQPNPVPRTRRYYLNAIVRYTYDTTLAVGTLILSGVLDRFPNLKIILSHGGGFFPYQVGRFDQAYRAVRETRELAKCVPSRYLRQFYYDSLVHHPEALDFLVKMVGVERVLLGTDYPFPMGDEEALTLFQRAALSPKERIMMAGGNAKQILKL